MDIYIYIYIYITCEYMYIIYIHIYVIYIGILTKTKKKKQFLHVKVFFSNLFSFLICHIYPKVFTNYLRILHGQLLAVHFLVLLRPAVFFGRLVVFPRESIHLY